MMATGTVNASDYYYKQIDRIWRKSHQSPPDKMIAEMRETFLASLDFLPDAVTHGLFNYCVQHFYANRNRYGSFHEVAEHMGNIVDLFNREYDERADPLGEDEWRAVQKLVSENAGEIELEVLEYVMKQIVSAGKFI